MDVRRSRHSRSVVESAFWQRLGAGDRRVAHLSRWWRAGRRLEGWNRGETGRCDPAWQGIERGTKATRVHGPVPHENGGWIL
jgi:hypothetical protein